MMNGIKRKFVILFTASLFLTTTLFATTPDKESQKPKTSEVQEEDTLTVLQLSPNQIWRVWREVKILKEEMEVVLNSATSDEAAEKYVEFLKKEYGIYTDINKLNPDVAGSGGRLEILFRRALRAYVDGKITKDELYEAREKYLGTARIEKVDDVKDSKYNYYFIYRADIPEYKIAADRDLIFMLEFDSAKKMIKKRYHS